ncbi:magnesium transporter CorA family protein, partial [uncultured Bartonella sp.]|uniref:magnesium transporter CorA family protein n=1 Tax=uncultured Bartonella sp. TaxID=104108 RepID=UPI0026199178
MIRSFRSSTDRLVEVPLNENGTPENDVLWIDLSDPTPKEEKQLEQWLGIPIPTHDDMTEIEESSRFYMENGAQYMTAPLIYAVNDKRNIAPVTFILTGFRLVTVRYSHPQSVELFMLRVTKAGNGVITQQCTGLTILTALIETATDRLADLLEAVSARIENNSRNIFHRDEGAMPMSTVDFRKILNQIGTQGTLLSMVRESIAGISRLLVYVEAYGKNVTPKYIETDGKTVTPKKDMKTTVKSLEQDTQSLEHYADFLSAKMTFLLDTVVGMISTEQNAIIKFFSVAAVGFMPPTLIASIYGMNFQFMPELNETWGYPFAIFLMIISAV